MKVDFGDMTVGGFAYEVYRGLSTQYTGAAELGECMDTMGRVRDGDFDSWVREWAATADRVSAYAKRQLEQGDRISARKAWLRASNYYRLAVFYAAPADPRHTELLHRSKACFQRMTRLMRRPVESVDIGFEGARLPAYFVSAGQGRRPTLIVVGGFDSTMEEAYCWIGPVAVEYGWHCLIFEGPGQWSALTHNPGLVLQADYERPVAAVVDYLLTRTDVEAGKLALIGYSLGGHLALRGALDPRISATISNSLLVDIGAAYHAGPRILDNPGVFDALVGLAARRNVAARWGLQHASWSVGAGQPHELKDAMAPFTLNGLEQKYENPILFLFSEDDIRNSFTRTPKLVVGLLDFMLALECERSIRLFTRREGASSHCQMGGLAYAHATVFQWLDHVARGTPTDSASDPDSGEAFVRLFATHGGTDGERKAKELLQVAHLI